MTSKAAAFFLTFWLLGVIWVSWAGSLILRVEWWRIRIALSRAKAAAVKASPFMPAVALLLVVLLCEVLGG